MAQITDSVVARWSLTLTNVFFLLPAIVAWKAQYWYEGTVYFMIAFISAMAHYTMWGTCYMEKRFCYRTFSNLDYIYSYAIIAVTTSMVLFDTSRYADASMIAWNRAVKQVVNTLLFMVVEFLVIDDVSMPYTITIVSGCCVVLLGAVILCRPQLLRIDMRDFVAGITLITLSLICKAVGETEGRYAVFHSLWHVFVAIGIALMVETRHYEWNVLSWMTCGYLKTPGRTTSASSMNAPASTMHPHIRDDAITDP
jgi:hypothetical protein